MDKNVMPKKLTEIEKLELAKTRTNQLVDKILELHAVDANNHYIAFSNILSKQISSSTASTAYIAFRESNVLFQAVRTTALWDRAKKGDKPDYEMVSIPAIVNLLDDETMELAKKENLSAFAHEEEFHQRLARKRNLNFEMALCLAKAIKISKYYKQLMNFRNKHIAHNLNKTWEEIKFERTIDLPTINTLHAFFRRGQCIVNAFHHCLNQTGCNFAGARETADQNAKQLWSRCNFNIKE